MCIAALISRTVFVFGSTYEPTSPTPAVVGYHCASHRGIHEENSARWTLIDKGGLSVSRNWLRRIEIAAAIDILPPSHTTFARRVGLSA